MYSPSQRNSSCRSTPRQARPLPTRRAPQPLGAARTSAQTIERSLGLGLYCGEPRDSHLRPAAHRTITVIRERDSCAARNRCSCCHLARLEHVEQRRRQALPESSKYPCSSPSPSRRASQVAGRTAQLSCSDLAHLSAALALKSAGDEALIAAARHGEAAARRARQRRHASAAAHAPRRARRQERGPRRARVPLRVAARPRAARGQKPEDALLAYEARSRTLDRTTVAATTSRRGFRRDVLPLYEEYAD